MARAEHDLIYTDVTRPCLACRVSSHKSMPVSPLRASPRTRTPTLAPKVTGSATSFKSKSPMRSSAPQKASPTRVASSASPSAQLYAENEKLKEQLTDARDALERETASRIEVENALLRAALREAQEAQAADARRTAAQEAQDELAAAQQQAAQAAQAVHRNMTPRSKSSRETPQHDLPAGTLSCSPAHANLDVRGRMTAHYSRQGSASWRSATPRFGSRPQLAMHGLTRDANPAEAEMRPVRSVASSCRTKDGGHWEMASRVATQWDLPAPPSSAAYPWLKHQVLARVHIQPANNQLAKVLRYDN